MKTPKKVIEEFRRNGIGPNIQVEYYSYPHIFGSTSGPRGGIGGQVMTPFQVSAYVSPVGTVYVCNGVVKFSKKNFDMGWPKTTSS